MDDTKTSENQLNPAPTPTDTRPVDEGATSPAQNQDTESKEGDTKPQQETIPLSDEEENMESVEYEGGLSDDLIAEGLSQLGRSADGTMQVYLTLFLPGCELTSIEPLAEYLNLQSVTLSHNSLTDLSPLGSMSNLISLDVSHNNLSKLLDFKPPFGLRKVNYSHNEICELPDLSAHQSLTSLNLDYNNITEIQGLMGCHNLNILSLMHNKIDKIANLENIPLQTLNLGYNNIKKIENLETLQYLQKIDLAKNCIRSIKGLQNHPLLQEANLEENQIIDIAEVRYVRELKLLRKLNLLNNPIQGMPDYRLSLLFRIQCLTVLDKAVVTPEEKVAAINLFNPPSEVIAARDHMLHVVRSLLEPSHVYDSTLPSTDTPYPMLILCGPSGAGKRILAKKLCQDFPDFFGLGVSHTTRPPRNKEENGEDYFFVTKDEFEAGVMSGIFLQTCRVGSHLYGVTRDGIERVARQGLAAVFHMEFEGMLSFKNTYFEPRYIMIVPVNRKLHEERMLDRGYYTDSQIEHSLDRVEEYLAKNRDCPGFFDMAINSDDLSEAYKRLKRLIIEYLGMTPPSSMETHEYSTTETSADTEDESYQVGVKSGTSNTSMTIPIAVRSWSRPSASSNAKKVSSTTDRTTVEEMSFVRRQHLAKAAVAGVHVLSHEDLNIPRYVNSAGFRDNNTKQDQKRALSYPLGYDTSFISMTVNASSGKEQTESTESDSEEDENNSSSVMSSARAYSERYGAQTPDEEDQDTAPTVDVLTLEFASQASESVALSAGLTQLQDANSI